MTMAIRLLADRRGNVAVEFALIGPLLLLCLFMIVDTGISLAAQHALDNAVSNEARKIEIGSIGSGDLATFKSDVCGAVGTYLASCSTTLQVYVTSGTTFQGLTAGTVSGGTLSPQTFNPGTGSSNVLVQVAYARSGAFPFLARYLTTTGSTLVSVATLKNEPFS